jgi:predicted oxidoreductase (fatty acid repression mutant protein)
MAAKIPTNDYLTAVKYRRTVYGLNDKSPVPDERILEIVREVALTSPSSYNTQPGRIIVLLGAPHKKLWDIVAEIGVPLVKAHAGEEMANAMSGRFQMFKGKRIFRNVKQETFH